MLANRVRMGIYSEELPIYLLESGTDSYLNWEIKSFPDGPDTSYGNSDFIHLLGVPVMNWDGVASFEVPINKGERNWLEVTFSYDQQDPPFSEQVTTLFDISDFASKTITELLIYSDGRVRLFGSDPNDSVYKSLPRGTFPPSGEDWSVRLYSICLK